MIHFGDEGGPTLVGSDEQENLENWRSRLAKTALFTWDLIKLREKLKKCQIFQGFKGLQLGLPGSEKKHEKIKVFKGFFKGGKKFKGFSRFSRAGGHPASFYF